MFSICYKREVMNVSVGDMGSRESDVVGATSKSREALTQVQQESRLSLQFVNTALAFDDWFECPCLSPSSVAGELFGFRGD
ncbi:hypothetical protein VNO80_22078 [Phaseolus coccineus]|uniref:Uncharacterized protein n=1 Tax=Phaseolus coccineus TaxID=3886 RepID=A0AAN9M3G5_PHACN